MKKIYALILLTTISFQSFALNSTFDCVQFAHDATTQEEEQFGIQYDFNTWLQVMNEWNTLCEQSEQ